MSDQASRSNQYKRLVVAVGVAATNRRGWQRQCALRLGISNGMFSKVITGQAEAGEQIIGRARTAFGIADAYFQGDGPPDQELVERIAARLDATPALSGVSTAGDRVRRFLAMEGLKFVDLARLIGVEACVVSDIMGGHRRPTLAQAVHIEAQTDGWSEGPIRCSEWLSLREIALGRVS